ncbi:hypothetical protein MMC30_000039 [Trapelia coarctata]|nr:hypothetical protein [Trapelia coarctata]
MEGSNNAPTSPVAPVAPASPNSPTAPTAPASSKPAPKRVDEQFVAHFFGAYQNGAYIDVLIQELVDQGYQRPSYSEIAYNLLPYGLQLSADRVLNEADKPAAAQAAEAAGPPPFMMLHPSMIQFTGRDDEGNETVIEDPERCQQLFDSTFTRERIPDGKRKPFDREGAIFIVERFRSGIFAEWVMDELDDLGYVTPSWEVFDRILAANGMNADDGVVVSRNGGFEAHEGRVWGETVIPEGIFDEEA